MSVDQSERKSDWIFSICRPAHGIDGLRNFGTNYREQEQGTIELESAPSHCSLGVVRSTCPGHSGHCTTRWNRCHHRGCVSKKEKVPDKMAYDERRRGRSSTV